MEILNLCHNHQVIDWLNWNPIWERSFVLVMVHSLPASGSRDDEDRENKNRTNSEKIVEWWIEDLRMRFVWTFFVMFDSISNIVRMPTLKLFVLIHWLMMSVELMLLIEVLMSWMWWFEDHRWVWSNILAWLLVDPTYLLMSPLKHVKHW